MKLAWIENDRIRDIAPGNPADLYHPDIAKMYDTDVPDDAANGDGWVNGQLVKPEPPVVQPDPVPAPVAPKVSPIEFKLLFTAQERVAIKAARASDPMVDDFMDILEDHRLTHVDLGLHSTRDAVAYMASAGLIAAGRVDQVLAGEAV